MVELDLKPSVSPPSVWERVWFAAVFISKDAVNHIIVEISNRHALHLVVMMKLGRVIGRKRTHGKRVRE